MRALHTLVCEGCSSLSGTPLAGLPALTTLRICRLNRLTYVGDDTCRDLALLPKVWHAEALSRCVCNNMSKIGCSSLGCRQTHAQILSQDSCRLKGRHKA